MEISNLTKEDVEFLKDLQNELKNQDTDYTRKPVIWGIMETILVPCEEGSEDEVLYYCDDTEEEYDLQEILDYLSYAVDEVNETYTLHDRPLETDEIEEINKEWNAVKETTRSYDIVDFAWTSLEIIIEERYYKRQEILSKETGSFLTKRKAKEYIDMFGYNHSNPKTYAMHLYRNFEFARLIEILEKIELHNLTE